MDIRHEAIVCPSDATVAPPVASGYLEDYGLRHKPITFAVYAIGNFVRRLGRSTSVDVTEKTVKAYQSTSLEEKAAPKAINEEVGFLFRVLGESS